MSRFGVSGGGSVISGLFEFPPNAKPKTVVLDDSESVTVPTGENWLVHVNGWSDGTSSGGHSVRETSTFINILDHGITEDAYQEQRCIVTEGEEIESQGTNGALLSVFDVTGELPGSPLFTRQSGVFSVPADERWVGYCIGSDSLTYAPNTDNIDVKQGNANQHQISVNMEPGSEWESGSDQLFTGVRL